MKILIIGANSYLGARLYLDLVKGGHAVTGTYHSTQLAKAFLPLDITDQAAVEQLIEKSIQPEIIIHVANNANAQWCAANPEAAVALNETATKDILASAKKIKAKIIYISSLVAADPATIYAETKLASEELVAASGIPFAIIRPSLIIGFSPNTSNDRPFNRILKNLDEATPAHYDTSWKFQPTYIGHISEIITCLLERGLWNMMIPVAVPELKSRYDLANDILGAFGKKADGIDKHDATPVSQVDLSILAISGLPAYSYRQIIEKIVAEIKDRGRFRLE